MEKGLLDNKTKDKTRAAHSATKPQKPEATTDANITGSSQETRALARAERKARQKRRQRLVGILIIIGVILLVAISATAIVGWKFLGSINAKISLSDLQKKELEEVLVEPESADAPYYVLLIGTDSRNPEVVSGNSDTIILVRVDPVEKKLSLLSIPRDTKITLEGHGEQKTNAALAYYGPAGAVRVVSELCGVEIAHYVEIDFQNMINLVDKLGGVEVNVPVNIRLKDDFIPKGKQILNGYQALVMSRCRNFPDGDFTRMKNQRVLMQAILRDILSASKTELPSLIDELANCVKTDVSSTKAISLLLKLQGLDTTNSLFMATAPAYTSNQNGISYVEIYWEDFEKLMEKFRAGEPLG